MIALKKVIAPVDDTPFDEICSFETPNYIGVYVEESPVNHRPCFVLMPIMDGEFSLECIPMPESLAELDEIVYKKVRENIQSVSTSRSLTVVIDEAE